MNLTRKIAGGIIWNGTSGLLNIILSFIILAILARLISPSDFGLMALITTVTNFVNIISDLGFGAALIQKHKINTSQFSSLFYLNIIMGFVFCGILFFSSPLIAVFFRNPELANLLKVISFSFILTSPNQIIKTYLQKKIDFRTIFNADIISLVIYGASSIYLAYLGLGIWSLIFGFLIKQTFNTVILFSISSFELIYSFDYKSIKGLLNFSAYVFADTIFNYFFRNLDNIIIGRFLGIEALGFYSLAYNLMLFPTSKISGFIMPVIFPAFSLIQHNNTKIRNGYLKVLKSISLISFPIMALLFVIAPDFVYVVYGQKWTPIIPIIQIFALVGALGSIGTTVGTILYVKGKPDISFKWTVFASICYGSAFLIGVNWGITGVAIAYTTTFIILFPVIQHITNNLINLKWNDFLKQFVNQILGAILIILSIESIKTFMLNGFKLSHFPLLMVSSLVGILIFVSFILLKEMAFIIELQKTLGIKRK